MFKLILTSFIIISASSKLDLGWWILGQSSLLKCLDSDTKKLKLIQASLNSKNLSKFIFNQIEGMGSYGIVFSGKEEILNTPISVKIQFEKLDTAPECTSTYLNYLNLNSIPGVKYLIAMQAPLIFKLSGSFACGLLMEKGVVSTKPMFKDTDVPKSENNDKMIGFMVKLLEGFYTINFIGGYYHADVKPENILFIESEDTIEPRIIDFDLMFKKVSPHFNPNRALYTLDQRAPELRSILPSTNIRNKEQLAKLKEYEFDADFREEAWAVGVSMNEILKVNENWLDLTDLKMKKLQEIIELLSERDIRLRICTEKAFNRAQKILPIDKLII